METREFHVIEKGKHSPPDSITKLPDIVDSTIKSAPRHRDRKKKNLLTATLTTTTATAQSQHPKPSTPPVTTTGKKIISFEANDDDADDEEDQVVLSSNTTRQQRHVSRSAAIGDKINETDNNNNTSGGKKPQEAGTLPQLISNDKRRSTSYRRFAKSSDFEKVKASPLATRFVYNWKPVERMPTRVVQAKVKVYKPPKRIEMTGRPSSPYRLCVDYETKDSHAHNHERTMAMKRLQYLKEHTEWSIYPYAGVEEREQYKYVLETISFSYQLGFLVKNI